MVSLHSNRTVTKTPVSKTKNKKECRGKVWREGQREVGREGARERRSL